MFGTKAESGAEQVWTKNGRGEEIWTPDLLVPNQARYQAALLPAFLRMLSAKGKAHNVFKIKMCSIKKYY